MIEKEIEPEEQERFEEKQEFPGATEIKPAGTEMKPPLEGKQVFCKNCQKDVFPVFSKGRWKCPDCKLFVKTKIPKKMRGKEIGVGEEAAEESDFRMTSMRPIALSGKDMALAEVMVNAGVAKNFSDLTRKALHVLYGGMNLPFNTQLNKEEQIMEKEQPDPKQTMKQIQEQEIMSAYAKRLAGDSGANPTKTMRELQEQKMIEAYIRNMGNANQTDPLQFMMLMRMLDNKDKGKEDNNFMDKMMQLQMVQSLRPQADQSLQREIADLKHTIATQQLLQQAQQKGAPTLNDQLMVMEKIRADRDTKIKEAEIEAQKQRDVAFRAVLDTKLKEMERAVEDARAGGSFGSQRIRELKEEIGAIKEMSHELGEREKSTGEYFAETVGSLANTLQPTFTKLIEQKQQPIYQPMPAEAYGAVQEAPVPPEMDMPDMHLPSSSLSPSEQQMAKQMSDMYIKEK